MKKLLLLPFFAIFMSFSKCDKSQVSTKSPSKIKKAYAQNWLGEKPSEKGTLVTIKLEKPSANIVFDSIYFNEKVALLNVKEVENGIILTGKFVEDNYPKPNLILSSDPREEFGNTPPPAKVKIPFKLEKSEAIVSYFFNDVKKYFLIKNIQKK